jgi:hypothetical protein
MSIVGHLPAEDARVVREDVVMRLLREDGLRAVTPLERAARWERYGSVEDYDPVLRAHCRL